MNLKINLKDLRRGKKLLLSSPTFVTQLLSPDFCHPTFVTRLLSPDFCHPTFVTRFLSPDFCHPDFCHSYFFAKSTKDLSDWIGVTKVG